MKGTCRGPATLHPLASWIDPSRRSWTYSRKRGLITSLADLGLLAISSDFHCATDARYSSLPPRVAALRVNSRETVEGLQPIRRAISRTPTSWARRRPTSSRSANDRHLPEIGLDMNSGMPPRCRNQRVPTACDTPTASAAFSLVIPVAICIQNSLSISRRCEGAPGECIAYLPVNCFIHPAGLPINTSW